MSDHEEFSISRFMELEEAGWQELQGFLAPLTDEQMTVPTDAAGWAIKDHLSHMAVWLDGVTAMLRHQDRRAAMGITLEESKSDIDEINEIIFQQHKHLTAQQA